VTIASADGPADVIRRLEGRRKDIGFFGYVRTVSWRAALLVVGVKKNARKRVLMRRTKPAPARRWGTSGRK